MQELPRKLNKKEQSITPLVMAWFSKNYPYDVAVEVKIKGNKEKKHQTAALLQVAKGMFAHKLKDHGTINPFDFIVLKTAHAFTVTCDGHVCTVVNKKDNSSFIIKV